MKPERSRKSKPEEEKADGNVVQLGAKATTQDLTTKDTILEAAIDCFARFGFEGTAMSAVARSAGVAQPLMHYYFASKDQLWRAAIEKAFDELLVQQEMNRELDELDPVSALRVLVRRFILLLARHPNMAPLLASESQFMTTRVTWMTDTYIAPLEKHLGEILRRGRQEGQIRDDLPTPYVTRFIIGTAAVFFMSNALMKRIYDIDTSDPEAIETYTKVTFELLFKGLLTTNT